TLATYYIGSSAPRVHHGRESIVRFLENTWLVRKDVSVFTRHMVMNTMFLDVSEQTAYVRSSFLITRQEMASFKIDIAYAGQYVDELYASDEGWLLSHRTVRFG
ncbi:MAG: nuclear transport factor 2 family protein, partial [Deinococcota bacterium]